MTPSDTPFAVAADALEIPDLTVADLQEGDWIQLTPFGGADPVDVWVTAVRPRSPSTTLIHIRRLVGGIVADETHLAAADHPLTVRRIPAGSPEPDDTKFQITWVVTSEESFTHEFTARQLREALGLPAGSRLGDLQDHHADLDSLLADAEGEVPGEQFELERDIETVSVRPAAH